MALLDDDIVAACDALDAAGEAVTQESVREKLGGKGSYSSIGPVVRRWKTSIAARKQAKREAPPPAIQGRGNEFITELWGLATEFADARLEACRQQFEAERAELHRELNETASLADRYREADAGKATLLEEVRRQLDDAKLDATAVRQQLFDKDVRLTETGEALATERERRQEADKAVAQVREETAKLHGTVAALEQQNQALLAQLRPALGNGAAG